MAIISRVKGFVKKYEKQLNGKDFKDMKAKFSEPKMSGTYVGPIDGIYSDFGDTNEFGLGANYTEKADEDTVKSISSIDGVLKVRVIQ